MKEKIKKYLCLMLSFVFVLSNCQLFAQNIPSEMATVNPAISEATIADMEKELSNLQSDFGNLKRYINQLFGDIKHAEGSISAEKVFNKLLEDFEKPYAEFIKEVNIYDSYITVEAQKTPMERLAYKYTGRNPLRTKMSITREGVEYSKLRDYVEYVLKKYRTTGVNFRSEVQQIQGKVNDILNCIEGRLALAEKQIKRTAIKNEEIYNLERAAVKIGITNDDVLKYAMRTIDKNDLQLIGLIKSAEVGKTNRLGMALGLKKYLRAVGSRRAKAPLLGMIRKISYRSLKSNMNPKYSELLKDFPIVDASGKYIKPKYTIKNALKAAPIAVLGAVLTANLITEIKSDNSFGLESVGPMKMPEIQKDIETGKAGIADAFMFYSNDVSDSVVESNPEHLRNAINLGLALKEADDNFDEIDNLLAEVSLEDYGFKNKVQADFDIQLNKAFDRILDDIEVL